MALVSNIQLQDGSVKPPNLDTNLKYTAAGLTATEAIAVGTVPVSTSGAITVKSANDIRNWIQTTKTDGNVEIYMSNDARPDWALRVAGTADNAFVIANSYGTNCTAQFPAFSIGGAGAVGIGKTGASNVLDIAYKNAATGGVQITQTQNNVGIKAIAESSSGAIGTSSNHKLGFRVNNTTVAAFNTSTQFGIGTDSPGATLDVRGGAIFNEAGAAVDFRIEGDANQNLFFVDGSADAIGMGTATPVDTSTLHIIGTDGDPSATHNADAMLIVENNGNTVIEIATSNTTYGALGFSDAGAHSRGAVLYDHGTGLGGGADTMHFQVAGAIKAVIDSGGEVGIGTLAPAAPIHIKKDGDPEIRIEAAADGDAVINFYQTTSCKATVAYQDTNDVFAIASNGTVQLQKTATTKLTISDCVGIGTTAPVAACGAQLDIYNTGATTGLMLRTGNTSAASATIRGEGYRGNGDNEQVMQLVGRNSNNSIDLGIFEVAAEAKHCTGALEFKTFDGSSMTQKMIITSAGHVGIGTASPGTSLVIPKNCTTAYDGDAPNVDNFALSILNTSNHTSGGVFAGIHFNQTGDSANRISYIGAITEDTSQNSSLVFGTDDASAGRTEKMRINSSGFVGIGTTAPATKLHLQDGALTNRYTSTSTNATAAASQGVQVQNLSDTDNNFAVGTSFYNSTGFETGRFGAIFRDAGDRNTDLYWATRANGAGLIAQMYLTSAGKLGIGTCTPACHLEIYNATAPSLRFNDGGDYKAAIKLNGNDLEIRGSSGVMEFYNGSADEQSSALRMTLTDAGKLGIGTSTPATELEISNNDLVTTLTIDNRSAFVAECNRGNISFEAISDADSRSQYAAINTFTTAGTYGAGEMGFLTRRAADGSTSEVMRLDDAGNIGIGTQSIASNGTGSRVLHIHGAPGHGTLHLTSTSSGVTNSDGFMLSQCAADAYIINRENGPLYIRTNDTNRIAILAGGNIGLGTNTPRANLTIQGDNTTAATFGIDNASGSATLDISALGGTYNAHGAAACEVWFYSPDNINIGGATGGSNDIKFLGAGAERVRITSGGKVGINTTTRGDVFFESGHSAQLQVEGTTVATSSISMIRNNAQYGPNLIIARSCGTSVGSNTLVAAGQSIGGISWQGNDGGEFIQAASIGAKVGNHAAADCMSGELQFYTNAGTDGTITERMRITEDGKVGIGTLTPNSTLHTVGSVGATTHMTAANGIYFGVAPGSEFEPVRIDTQSNGGGTCQLFIGNAAITVSSDRRVKNNIQCYTCSAVNVLDNARVVEFEYDKEKISDRSDFGPSSRGKYVGLIAQEMIEYARWAINDGEGDPEGEHIWKAEYEHMVPLLIKAVQELNERIEELESK